MSKITSIKNQRIKDLLKLRKSKIRKANELVLVDGLREIKEAYLSKFIIEEVFYCPELIKENYNFKFKKTELSEKVFKKLAYPENPDGWLALIKPINYKLDKIKLSKNPLIIVLEGLEKPGNLGAIIRTASAVKVDCVIINDEKVDPYNPNVIRASTGMVFNTKTLVANNLETHKWLKNNNITIFATTGNTEKSYYKTNFKKPMALIFGSEAFGLSDFWLNKSSQLVKIPMRNNLDSLNVSVSVGVFVFEVLRQRGDIVD
jgi:RNA methyltransferase, TrmH family